MESNGKFVAQMLNTSALGYAGLATSLLFERHPEIASTIRRVGSEHP